MVVVFIASRIFASERDSGFSYILRASKRGRRETSGAKLAAVTVMSSMVYLVFCVVDLIFLCLNYGTLGFGAGIMSIPEDVLHRARYERSRITRCIENIIQFVGYSPRPYCLSPESPRSAPRASPRLSTPLRRRLPFPQLFRISDTGITGALSFVRFSSVSDVSGAFPCAFMCTVCMFADAVMRSAELERRKNSFYPLTNGRLYAINITVLYNSVTRRQRMSGEENNYPRENTVRREDGVP